MSQQVFTSSGTFTVPLGVTAVDVLVVAGGGGGGHKRDANVVGGSGGGAGGVLWVTNHEVTPLEEIAVTVGTGGAGGVGATNVGP
jgi:NADH:ubiquinone oxidoreductase subunit F (NADH-binding)